MQKQNDIDRGRFVTWKSGQKIALDLWSKYLPASADLADAFLLNVGGLFRIIGRSRLILVCFIGLGPGRRLGGRLRLHFQINPRRLLATYGNENIFSESRGSTTD